VETRSLWQIDAPAPARPALSGDITADVCIVGAGITGVSCAWRLLEQGLSVVMLEARDVAGGASGRNGGFASTGTALGHAALAARLGDAGAARLQRATEEALDEMEALARELRVPEAVRRTGSLWLADETEAHDMRAMIAAAARGGIRAEPARERIPPALRRHFADAVHLPQDGELLPALWVRALAGGAADRGAVVFERSPVVELDPEGGGWRALSPAGSVTADAVVIACDGLIPEVAPQLAGTIYPVRGQVAATAVLPPARRVLDVPAHSLFGFFYYRPTGDGRIVVGGGRVFDLEAEYTDEERATMPIQSAIDRFAAETLGLDGVPMEHRWAGIMGFSADRLPLAGPLPGRDGLYIAGGYSGVGNVQGHLCGRLVADLIATGSHPLATVYDPARPMPAEPEEHRESRACQAALAARG
jgi:gamma-glutamylputrescine oxidase